MAVEYGGLDLTFESQAAVVQYCWVKVGTAAGTAILCAESGTVAPLGIAQETVTSAEGALGKKFTVRVNGVSKMKAGAVVAYGASVMPESGGTGITATGANTYYSGRALQASTASGDFIPVLLQPYSTANS
jgi:hypothetical protein